VPPSPWKSTDTTLALARARAGVVLLVLQGWITDPAYHDRDGVPKPLPMRGGDVSFEGLVRRFAGDVTPVATNPCDSRTLRAGFCRSKRRKKPHD